MNDLGDRRAWLESVVSADAKAGSERTDRSKTLAARATLEMAEGQWLAFSAVRLNAPLAENLKLKRSLMESALCSVNRLHALSVYRVQ